MVDIGCLSRSSYKKHVWTIFTNKTFISRTAEKCHYWISLIIVIDSTHIRLLHWGMKVYVFSPFALNNHIKTQLKNQAVTEQTSILQCVF